MLSLAITLGHLIPFNIPVLLLFIPIALLFPQLASSEEEVTYGFAWLEIHAWWVWAILFVWHSILTFPIVFLFLSLGRRKRLNK
ncbi:hypothetical protein [Synechococcus elongatus]|uniref:hypothetical protein n=1 Tax=Synechococcus elongatus TaxID=32046 RepID=UPI0030CF8E10